MESHVIINTDIPSQHGMVLVAGHGIRPKTRFWRGPDRYDYHFNRKVAGGNLSFRCVQYFLGKCQGRASLSVTNGFRQTQEHNHDPDVHRLQSRSLRHALMERCRTGDHTSNYRMYHQERRRLRISRQAAASIPLVSLRPSMRRARLENRPRIPHTLKQLNKILASRRYRGLSRTIDGKSQLFAGRAGSASRKTLSLLFVTKRMLRYLRRVRRIFCDATFSPVPRGLKASQVWTISTIRLHHVVPLVRVLMRKRKKAAYTAVLEKLKELAPGFKPREVFADFEAGEQAALRLAFPNAKVHGCLFHYAKAIGGRARKLKMTRLIRRSSIVRRLVRSFCVLPLLPQKFIMRGFRSILRLALEKNIPGKIIGLATYWLRTWRPKLHILSVSGCADRTTNCCECDNRMLQDAVREKRPNVWNFMDGILEMEDCTEQDLHVLRHSKKAVRRRSVSAVANDQTIRVLTEELKEKNISVRTFLKDASYTIVKAFNRGLNGKKKRKNT